MTRTGPSRETEEERDVARTQDFEQTVAERAKRDPTFARRRSIRLSRSSSTARLILRDLVTATIGFETLGRRDCEAGYARGWEWISGLTPPKRCEV
jgi:hypothetical protein